jgi:hypothetical protein
VEFSCIYQYTEEEPPFNISIGYVSVGICVKNPPYRERNDDIARTGGI